MPLLLEEWHDDQILLHYLRYALHDLRAYSLPERKRHPEAVPPVRSMTLPYPL